MFYTPRSVGFEGQQQEKLLRYRALQLQQGHDPAAGDDLHPSTTRGTRAEWLERGSEQRIAAFDALNSAIFAAQDNGVALSLSDSVYIVGVTVQSFLWAALSRVAAASVTVCCVREQEYRELAYHIAQLPQHKRPIILHREQLAPTAAGNHALAVNAAGRVSNAAARPTTAASPTVGGATAGARYTLAISVNRSRAFMHSPQPYDEQWSVWVRRLAAQVNDRGYIALVERLPGRNVVLSNLLRELDEAPQIVDMVTTVESYVREHALAYRFDQEALAALLAAHGFVLCQSSSHRFHELRTINHDVVRRWLYPPTAATDDTPSQTHAFAQAAAAVLSPPQIAAIERALVRRLCDDLVSWPVDYTVLTAQRRPS